MSWNCSIHIYNRHYVAGAVTSVLALDVEMNRRRTIYEIKREELETNLADEKSREVDFK